MKPAGRFKCAACGTEWDGSQLYQDPRTSGQTCGDLTCGGNVRPVVVEPTPNELEAARALYDLIADMPATLLISQGEIVAILSAHRVPATTNILDSIKQIMEKDRRAVPTGAVFNDGPLIGASIFNAKTYALHMLEEARRKLLAG